MKRPVQLDPITLEIALGPRAASLPIEERAQHLQTARVQSADHSAELDRRLLRRLDETHAALSKARENLGQLDELIGKLTATPWFPAVFIETHSLERGGRAVVQFGTTRRVVDLHREVDLTTLRPGDEVFLSHELNVIMGVSPQGVPRCGDLAAFDRKVSDGRWVVKLRDGELVVTPAQALAQLELTAGDLVSVDPIARMAFEKFERSEGKEFLLKEVPPMNSDQLGGQQANFGSLLATLTTALVAPEKAKRYGLSGQNTILLVGPPGCGKTLLARLAASEISRISGKKCRFGVIKPAAWESPYVGETQRAIRETFRALAEAAQDAMAVLFIDEIESIGRTRGGFSNVHSDKFLAALLAELNGFEDRKNVAIISATNRKDLIDPALLERLSDQEIQISRPDLRAAREILGIHLPAWLPFSPNGELATATRGEIIEAVTSRFYAPNADNSICKLRFRDGKERMVHARELVSGRFFEQVCREARRRACLRDIGEDEAGVGLADMEDSIVTALQRLRSTLTIHNAHAYLSDLPQDVDVVSVEPVVRKVPQARRYLNVELH